jgi:hypothetical protein
MSFSSPSSSSYGSDSASNQPVFLSNSSASSPRSSASSLPPITPDLTPVVSQPFQAPSLLPGTNDKSPGGLASSPSPSLASIPVYAKTNTSLPDQLPSFDDIRFDPLGGPFPVFGKTSHAMDPHGLNAYLMHPEDQLWNYLQPRPRNSLEISTQPSSQQQQPFKADPFVKHLAKSPLGRPPLVLGKPEPIKFPDEQEEQAGETVKKGSFKSKLGLGFGKAGAKTSKSSTSLSSLVESTSTVRATGAKSQPGSPTRAFRSVERIEEDETVTSPGTVTSPTSGLDERTIKGSPVLLDQKSISDSLLSPVDLRPASTSRWSWLGMGPKQQRKKSGSIAVVKKPTKLHEAAPLDPGLSADPLAGVLPDSVPADATPAVNESLHLLTRTRSPMPESLRAMRSVSIKKLENLRAPSPNPILLDASIPAYLAKHGSDVSSSKRLMKFPRSVNSRQLPGMGLGPAEAGMRIDVGVRALLEKIDSHELLDLSEISTMTVYATTTGKKMPNGLSDLANIKAKIEQNARRGPGIPAFLARPGFEYRMWCYDEDGKCSRIESDYVSYELEFSPGLLAFGEEISILARDGRLRYTSCDNTVPGRPIQASSRSTSREALQDDEFNYGKPEVAKAAQAPIQMIPRSNSSVKFPSSQPTLASLPRSNPTGKTPRKQKPINWAIASDSESSESDSEESESEDEGQPLSRVGTRQKPVEMEPLKGVRSQGPPASRPNNLTRPTSLIAGHQQQSSRTTAVSRPPLDRRTTDERRRTEADLTAKYREHVMQTRERRDQARVGVVERQRAGDAMREKERDRRKSLAGISPIVMPEKTGRSARNTSAPVSPHHVRNNSEASTSNGLSALGSRPHRKSTVEPSRLNPDLGNHGLSRRSMSYADVRASTMQQPFAVPHQAPFLSHSMSFSPGQPQVMYVPVPVMHYPQPSMGFMPMHPMMGQQPQQTMPPNFSQMRRQSIGIPILSPHHTGSRHTKNVSGHQSGAPMLSPNHTGPRHGQNTTGHQQAPQSSRPTKRTPVQ